MLLMPRRWVGVAGLAWEAVGRAPPPAPVPSETRHFTVTVTPKSDASGKQHDMPPPAAPKPCHRRGGPSGPTQCNADELKILCLNTPGCAGFSSDGIFKNPTTPVNSGEPCDPLHRSPGARGPASLESSRC